jgi:hypothetical protein
MNDRELLELAAKAAGIEYGWQHIYDDYEGSTSEKWDWNPLTDDGDALRLVVKLGLTIQATCFDDNDRMFTRVDHYPNTGGPSTAVIDEYGDDPYAATRRAIVRAAAAIGETIA